MFRTSTLVIIMDLLNVMTIINYRPLYCLFASKFYAFGIPSRQFLAPPLDRTIETAKAILAQFEIVRRVRDCSRPLDSVRECSEPLASWGGVLGLIVVLDDFGWDSGRQNLHSMLTDSFWCMPHGLVLVHASSKVHRWVVR